MMGLRPSSKPKLERGGLSKTPVTKKADRNDATSLSATEIEHGKSRVLELYGFVVVS